MIKRLFISLNVVFIIAIFILGFNTKAFQKKNILTSYNNKFVSLWGMVCEEEDNSLANQKLTFCARSLKTKTKNIRLRARVLINLKLYPQYHYGDFLLVSGYLVAPTHFSDFAYDRYLARYNIYSVFYYPRIKKSSGQLGWGETIFFDLLKFKSQLKKIINRNLPEPSAGLTNAILLGYRHTVSRKDLALFSRIGLSHMIAISGAHITIISALIISLFMALGLKRKRALIFVGIFLVVYPLIIGLRASAVRASIMGAIGLWSIYSRSQISAGSSLLFSASIMLMINPQLLRADLGFQLSFLAVLGIIYLYPLGDRLVIKRIKNKVIKSIAEVVNLTFVAQIITLPILLINFKQISLIAPLANVLILWAFSLLITCLIIALFLSSIFPFLSLIFFWPSYLLLKFILITTRYLASFSFAAIKVNNFTYFKAVIYYTILCIVVLIIKKKYRF